MPPILSGIRLNERLDANLFPCWIDDGTSDAPALFTRSEIEAARERARHSMEPFAARPGVFLRLWTAIWG